MNDRSFAIVPNQSQNNATEEKKSEIDEFCQTLENDQSYFRNNGKTFYIV